VLPDTMSVVAVTLVDRREFLKSLWPPIIPESRIAMPMPEPSTPVAGLSSEASVLTRSAPVAASRWLAVC
jgi:hypothetical protein